MKTMPIGKYAGKYFYELEGDYLLWCLSQSFFYIKYKLLWDAVGKEVERRGLTMVLTEIAIKRNGEAR